MPKRKAILPAVSMKKPSGTMLMSMSVEGSKIHRSLLKKMWWNITKYFVKLVDIIRARAAMVPKKRPVPTHREGQRTCFILAFVKTMKSSRAVASPRQIRRKAMAFRNRIWTSSMWAISRALKNSRCSPPMVVVTWRSSRSPLR